MSVQNKKYLIRYYQAQLYKSGKPVRLSQLMNKIISGDTALPVRALIDQSSDFQVRGLHATDGGRTYCGCFVRFRNEIPVTGTRTSLEEKPVVLDDGHEILEKNYFVLFAGDNYDVLVYQPTMEGGTVGGLARYFSAIAGDTMMVSFNEILTEESLESLMKGGNVKYIDFKVAKPKAKRWKPDPEDTWTQHAIDFMNETGATSFQARVQTQSPTKGLLSDVLGPVSRLLESCQTKKLKVKLSSVVDPIDLFAERIKDKIDVVVTDGRPEASDVYKAIWASKIKMESRLVAYLGANDETLDNA
tara:strand:- start:414 stop:1319 length:906 start_codon:yes stop_codon:yes gene_type:complete